MSHHLFPYSSRRHPAASSKPVLFPLIFRSVVPLVLRATRQVSKQFCSLAYDHPTWRTLYRNACLPRPPGPFPSQSVQFLERTLVESERLAHSWTTQPMRDVSTAGTRHRRSIIMYGKWLISCEKLSGKFVVHDLDSNAGPQSHQLLWESALPICSWNAGSVVSARGLLIYVVFVPQGASELYPSWSASSFTSDVHVFHVHVFDH